jgi:hypothetical protein
VVELGCEVKPCPPEVEGSTIIKQPEDRRELVRHDFGTSNWLAIAALARRAAGKASGG